jgi:O-antigen/teichoic acid export membrane protein
MNQLRTGAALSYLNIFVSNLLNLLFTPFMLRSLGQSGYGLYALMGALVAYMGVLDFGLGNAIIRYVAKFRAEGDAASEGALLRVCVRIYGSIAALTLLIGACVLPNLRSFFGATLSAAELSDARALFILMTVNLALSFPFGAFNAVILGHERFVFHRTVSLVRMLLRTGVLVALLLLGYKALAIVVVDTCLNVAVGLLSIGYVRLGLGVRSHPKRFERSFIREVVFYSLYIFVNLIVDQLFWRIGHLVLGATAGTAAVAVFAIAMQLAQYYRMFPMAVSGVFLPRITAMVVSGASERDILSLFARTARVQLLALAYILGGFTLFGREFLHLWAGPAYASAWQVALVVMIPLTVPLAQTVGIHIQQAKNMHQFRSLLYLAIAVANALLSVLLVRRWGALGAALGTTVALVLGHILAMNLYYHHRIGLDMRRFARLVVTGIVPASLAAIGAGALLTLVPGYSWPKLLARIAVFTGLYGAAMWSFGMNTYEKGLFRSALGAVGLFPQSVAARGSTEQ